MSDESIEERIKEWREAEYGDGLEEVAELLYDGEEEIRRLREELTRTRTLASMWEVACFDYRARCSARRNEPEPSSYISVVTYARMFRAWLWGTKSTVAPGGHKDSEES